MKPRAPIGSVHDLPEDLPPGENVLWQGAPAWWPLARSLHLRLVAGYFAVWLAYYGASRLGHGGSVLDFDRMAALSLGVVGLFAAYAFLVARTTSYTITNRRIVLQAGIALPLSFNIPYARIAAADIRRNADGSGDLILSVSFEKRLGYVAFWPHARPWHVKQPQPMLRAVPDIDRVARILTPLLTAAAAPLVTPAATPHYAAPPVSAAA